jgi:hypothetical protein
VSPIKVEACREFFDWQYLVYGGTPESTDEDRFISHLRTCIYCQYNAIPFIGLSHHHISDPDPVIHLRLRRVYIRAGLANLLPLAVKKAVNEHNRTCRICRRETQAATTALMKMAEWLVRQAK